MWVSDFASLRTFPGDDKYPGSNLMTDTELDEMNRAAAPEVHVSADGPTLRRFAAMVSSGDRRRRPRSRKRSRRLELRATPEESDLIDRAAAGTDRTAFLVTNAVQAARRVLADGTVFELDADALAEGGHQPPPGPGSAPAAAADGATLSLRRLNRRYECPPRRAGSRSGPSAGRVRQIARAVGSDRLSRSAGACRDAASA
jgi:Protein of unknown function (DUF1778)